MPMHDWTTVEAGTFHTFHFQWTAAIMNQLNAGLLPRGYYAAAERIVESSEPDVLAYSTNPANGLHSGSQALIVLPRPKTSFVYPLAEDSYTYARKANRIVVRGSMHDVVAVVEIVSPGNKDRRAAIDKLVSKTVEFLSGGVNVLVIDPFPPGFRDPQGIHALIWEYFQNDPFKLPLGKNLTVASYQTAEPDLVAYVEPIAVGDQLPIMHYFSKVNSTSIFHSKTLIKRLAMSCRRKCGRLSFSPSPGSGCSACGASRGSSAVSCL